MGQRRTLDQVTDGVPRDHGQLGEARPSSRRPPNFNMLAVKRIREGIFSGELKPNQRIDQDGIAEELGISKLPVREALIMLETEGLVINLARRGCYVAPLTREDIRDHYTLIAMVSGLAAARAATKISPAELDELRLISKQWKEAESPADQERLNFEFHRLINRVGGSGRLLSALRLFANTMPTHFFEFTQGWASAAEPSHKAILEALAAGDPAASERAMVQHIRGGADRAVQLLEEQGFWD